MKKNRFKKLLVIVLSLVSLSALIMHSSSMALSKSDKFKIKEGIISQNAQGIRLTSGGRQATIKLTMPVVVAQADQEESWGYFQFPNIGRADDGTLIVGWTMKEDSHMAFGKTSDRPAILMMSKNGGNSWFPQDKNYLAFRGSYKVHMSDGDVLQVTNPSSKAISSYSKFPQSVGEYRDTKFYPLNQLPEELQGVYLVYYDAEKKKSRNIHSKLIDEGALRYAIGGYMPVVWWGDIKELSDGSLYAGTYPSYYLDKKGKVMQGGVAFYKSKDRGLTWERVGNIPYHVTDPINLNDKNKGVEGFQEPAFEVLADGTFICVMRTGSASPMYQSFSYDKGVTWTTPEPIAPNGVKPSLMLLDNGVLVLASGRPGIQLRFSLDGTGEEWTEPIDMMPFMDEEGKYDTNVSCGYPAILEDVKNSFYIVYSDFKRKTSSGEYRKAIMCRKVMVNARK